MCDTRFSSPQSSRVEAQNYPIPNIYVESNYMMAQALNFSYKEHSSVEQKLVEIDSVESSFVDRIF